MSRVDPNLIAVISIMPVSKTVIPLDDEESIRRFTEQIKRRSTPSLPSLPSLQLQVEDLEGMITQPNSDSHVEHRATQTDPVMITQANGGSHTRNGFLAKPKSALDSVLLQSPPGSGVMAPPSTPENRPGLSNAEISQLIVNNIESLPATSTFTLGESRHAPRHYSTNKGHHPNVRGSSANDHVSSSMSVGQTSPADRNIRNQSFPRMSFQAADSPSNAVPKTSSPPVSPTDTMENASSWSVLEKSVSSSRWASPQANPPATEPRNARPTPVPWESVGKYTEMNEKPEKGSLDSGIGSISRGTAELAVSVNEQVDSLIEGDTAKPTKPKDNWLPPHLRTPDYAFKDPRVVKPNRSYLTRNKPSAEVPKENKKPPTDDLVTSPVAEITTTPAPAQVVAMPDDPVLSKSILREVSPPTATEDTKENREGQLYFSAWGKPEERFKAGIWPLTFLQRSYLLIIVFSSQSPKGCYQVSQLDSFARYFTCVGWYRRRNQYQAKFG